MSLTLTLVDEENIRQRLLEIRKQKLRRNFKIEQQGLAERFQKIAETTLFENQTNILGKEDEEKALILRYYYQLIGQFRGQMRFCQFNQSFIIIMRMILRFIEFQTFFRNSCRGRTERHLCTASRNF